ncbi:YbhB/YbcL family Raf kinase inhibitor-like protein [Dactylosporangium vinaceum]|uniref:YbhB/YbcL family Raf kinase inhibitor-like protein n=1 Tax=Dactylosporangium vinaceum TaxID=53362 RepID=A0ABV5MDP8_9ACTN|nr:YbhB/YbcL family Raf kinase inhibitor-like protein [Dactylosporangium vinaceum]UAC01085.1 YbhB/YbcL family Raf kinase inhibitor-like protein [Dactylosporangium vinaceum]
MTTGNDPFARIPEVPAFTLTSATVAPGGTLPGDNVSPELSWGGAPAGTRSYAVTVYDPDAPTGSGFWHWAVANLPATTTTLPAGAGIAPPAVQLPNDARLPQYVGAAPPEGHGEHRYFITVHALDVEDIGVAPDATPAMLGFLMLGHTLARATLVATASG